MLRIKTKASRVSCLLVLTSASVHSAVNMKLKEVSRNATVAWSPLAHHPDLIATGAVSGSLDATFSSSAELEIFPLELSNKSSTLKPLGSASTPYRFNRLAWGVKGLANFFQA